MRAASFFIYYIFQGNVIFFYGKQRIALPVLIAVSDKILESNHGTLKTTMNNETTPIECEMRS